ncbi:hypothetical protein [Rhizobium terrae]|uniref:hypothetical protein n=1 Tax=Rhizobium terrae TaxID=2171756 RepID=UPI000E3E65E7|nr:hypothetical protein [Rhizobium terrae]
MASPWKFLARLVSPRRQQRQENGSTDDVTPELLAAVKPSETAGEESENAADRLAGEELQAQDQADARLADPQHFEATSSVQSTTDIENTGFVEADDLAHSHATNAALLAPKLSPTGEEATPKSSRRGKSIKSLEAVPQPFPSILAVSDDALSLDEEIRSLRNELVSKLQLQNAQLKRMLERFER